MKQSELLFWIWLSEALGAGNPDFRNLLDLYQSPYEIFRAEPGELERIKPLSEKSLRGLSDKNLERASGILDTCERLGIRMMTYQSDLYPTLLKEIKRPPALLYYVGEIPDLNKRLCIGMVGTRKMSVYGMETAYKIAYELAAMNAVVVSGMAAGIDGVSAAAALRAKGNTIAVLGCGLDMVYPAHHGLLMQKIAENGLLLSEYAPGTKPVYFHFPVRNRIISGLSHAIVVVEAGVGSGSLITAKEAILQNRDVFAIPASGDGIGQEGANGLLRNGAIFATETTDITSRYAYLFTQTLHTGREREAKKHSKADPEYLRKIGVLKSDGSPRNEREEPATVASGSKAPPVPQPAKPCEKPRMICKTEKRPSKKEMPSGSMTKVPARKPAPDDVLQSLPPVQLAVLQAIPDDGTVTADSLAGLGFPFGDIIMALTMLEISGLIQKLPGALYKKA